MSKSKVVDMSKSDEKVLDMIKEMAHMTIFFNRISSLQAKNLQQYPFVFFNGLNHADIEYDFESINQGESPTVGASYVHYSLYLDIFAENENIEYRCQSLERAVRELFWKEVSVEIYINEKLAYKSK